MVTKGHVLIKRILFHPVSIKYDFQGLSYSSQTLAMLVVIYSMPTSMAMSAAWSAVNLFNRFIYHGPKATVITVRIKGNIFKSSGYHFCDTHESDISRLHL